MGTKRIKAPNLEDIIYRPYEDGSHQIFSIYFTRESNSRSLTIKMNIH